VATVLANCRELVEIMRAVPSLGATNVPLSPLLLAPRLLSGLKDAAAVALVTELPARLRERILLVDGTATICLDLAALRSTAPEARVSQDDLFNITCTSDTTGLPKGIMHTYFVRSMYSTLMASASRMTPESVVLHTGALVFNGAFVTFMPCFDLGAHYVLAPQFNAAEMIELVAKYKVTHTMMVPARIVAMLDAPNFSAAKLASLQMILSLGAPLHQEQKDTLNRLLPGRFYELYGLTEGFVTILDVTDATRKSGSVGIPAPFNEMRIVPEDGTDATPNEVGEIAGRGPMLMTGYYGRPDLTAQAVRNGWLFSDDMGFVAEEG